MSKTPGGVINEVVDEVAKVVERDVLTEHRRDPSTIGSLLGLLVMLILSSLLVSLWSLAAGKEWSEVVKNVVETLAVLGGVCAVIKWVFERKDRATDILLKLEQECFAKNTKEGRLMIEEGAEYKKAKDALSKAVKEEDGKWVPSEANLSDLENASLEKVDKLLRFYVVLCGVREANQVPNASLSTCYRFWLAHYHHPDRPEFRHYVDAYFPTLRLWLERDEREGCPFFRPEEFGWKKH